MPNIMLKLCTNWSFYSGSRALLVFSILPASGLLCLMVLASYQAYFYFKGSRDFYALIVNVMFQIPHAGITTYEFVLHLAEKQHKKHLKKKQTRVVRSNDQ
jgi:hypothetical protein